MMITRLKQISLSLAVCIILHLYPTHLLFALSPTQLIHYYNKRDYSTVISKVEDAGKYDMLTGYLFFKSLLKKSDLVKANTVLKKLEKKSNWGLGPIFVNEKLNLFLKKDNKRDLLNLLESWSVTHNSPFFLSRIKEGLNQFDVTSQNRRLVAKPIRRLLITMPELNEDPDVLLILLSSMQPKDGKRHAILAAIWAYTDISGSNSQPKVDIGFIKKDIKKYKESILNHFKAQKRYGNHSYIILEILSYLKPIKAIDKPIFDELSQIYFRSMIRKRRYSDLIRLISSDKGRRYFGLSRVEALKMEFNLWIKKGHSQKGIAILRRLKKNDRHMDLNDYYLSLADFYFRHDKYGQSLFYYEKIRLEKLTAETIADIKWNIFLIHHKSNRQKELKKIAQWADHFNFDLPGNAAKFCYWGYKLKLFENRDPVVCYQQYPHTYYGLKALHLNSRSTENRLTEFTSGKKNKLPAISARDRQIVSFVSLLYSIDETEMADALVAHYMSKNNGLGIFINLASQLVKYQRYYLLQTLGYGYFGDALVENTPEARSLLPYFYPAGFHKQVGELSRRFKVPQMLVFSVIREESHFKADAKSQAGAIGLMQLMPKTAVFIGQTIRKKISLDRLTDPATNMLLGTAYLRRLLKRYKGNFYYTLAAYNGGATNVKRWRRKIGLIDEDHFVEKITFNETKSYVKRVMRSYFVYQNLYGQVF